MDPVLVLVPWLYHPVVHVVSIQDRHPQPTHHDLMMNNGNTWALDPHFSRNLPFIYWFHHRVGACAHAFLKHPSPNLNKACLCSCTAHPGGSIGRPNALEARCTHCLCTLACVVSKLAASMGLVHIMKQSNPNSPQKEVGGSNQGKDWPGRIYLSA